MRPVALALALVAAACAAAPPSPISISLTVVADGAPAFVSVTGLSSRELAALRAIPANDDRWPEVLRVTVTGEDVPIVGAFRVTEKALEFHPRFPFDPGRAYLARVDATRWSGAARTGVTERTLALAAPPEPPPTAVTGISPSGDRWPSNLLRFYVYFSAPMSRTNGVGLVHVLDEHGREVPEALLSADVDLWNADHTRFTVFFDPGRVKRGILPNREHGRPLVSGRRYSIRVDAAWPDAHGRPLREPFMHAFVAGPAVERALDARTWRIDRPPAGSSSPLLVTFPGVMDRGLIERALGVNGPDGRALAGKVDVAADDSSWRFTPGTPWRAGVHALVAATIVEDPSGNRLDAAFEVDPAAFQKMSATRDAITIPFEIEAR